MRNSKKSKQHLLLLVLSLLPLLLFWTKCSKAQKPTLQTVRDYARSQGLSNEQAKVVAAVAANETGNFNSALCKKCNNLFGMGVPKSWNGRYSSTYVGVEQVYSCYSDWRHSVLDFIDWCNRYTKGIANDPETQVRAMHSKNYFTGKLEDYIRNVKIWYQRAL